MGQMIADFKNSSRAMGLRRVGAGQSVLFPRVVPSRWPETQRHPIVAAQVAFGAHVDPAGCGKTCPDGVSLIITMLDQQGAARHQSRRRAGQNGMDGLQTVGLVGQRAARFKAEIALA